MPPVPAGGRVFLTGGTGFLGSHVAALLRSEGFSVRALHRPGSDTAYLEAIGCELVEGRLEDGASSLAQAMRNCDVLVHGAAVIYAELPWSRVREINVLGAARVFQGGADAGVRRGVHLSSIAVYGNRTGRIDEETPLDAPLPPRARYARSKREAETAVSDVARERRMAVTILRPSVVYGERDRLFIPKLRGLLRLPVHPLLGGGRTAMAAIYAGNLAHAVLRALTVAGPARTRCFNVAEDHPITQRTLLGGLAGAVGVPFRPISLPRGLALLGARVGDTLGVRMRGVEELSLARAVQLATRLNPYATERIRAELGWLPPIPLEEGLGRTAEWLKTGGDPSD
ncbi:MAG: NAD-dependent epimerase/dehydratase family protein [Gemmatimonadota bacterium]